MENRIFNKSGLFPSFKMEKKTFNGMVNVEVSTFFMGEYFSEKIFYYQHDSFDLDFAISKSQESICDKIKHYKMN